MKLQREIEVGSSKLSITTGHLARQANGSVTVRSGDTVVLATACMDPSADRVRSFLPLTVDYREYTYAAGRIPGGFFKREGRPTEKEIITSRLTDRSLRPLFPEGYFHETQIIAFVLSADGVNDPDVLAINGASFALTLSDVPYFHPVGAVRVGMIDGELVFNPDNAQRDVSDLDLVVVGTGEAVVMVEAAANQVTEDVMLEAIFAAHREIQKLVAAQREMATELGIEKPVWTTDPAYPAEVGDKVRAELYEPLKEALHAKAKFERRDRVRAVVKPYLEAIPAEEEELRGQVKKAIGALEERILRDVILADKRRFDHRALDEIRDIAIEVGMLPRTHGSALFTRGETQALVSATLGTQRDAQIIEEYEGESRQKFMLHYNFPPFSVGEVKFLRSPGRREIGHGVLARRALMPVMPAEDEFPYTIRVVSDILESNGSSSMATVCGGSLSLFDAGVPMLAPVAGVAMGLIKEGDEFAVLSDIAGQEDHYGDMDFKVAGTRNGVTALQMDIKIEGVTREVMRQALEQARRGRFHILDKMEEVLGDPRTDLSRYAPRLYSIRVPVSKIRDIIGPGGKMIRSIQEETGAEINIEDDGTVTIASPDEAAAQHAIELIERLTEVPEEGKIYTGLVRRVENYGAFVEIMPGTDGLLHVSEISPGFVDKVSDEIKEGDEVTVKVINVDDTGKIRLSRKAVIMADPNYDPSAYETVGAAAGGDRGGRSDDRGGRGPDRGGRGGNRGGGGRGGRGGGGGGRSGGGSGGGRSGGSGSGGDRW